jgi:formyltetrahydrofolate deformylase
MRPNEPSARNVLLISCRDQTGLIHAITGALLKRKLNIVENSEFVDDDSGMFFMRTEFEGVGAGTELLDDLRAQVPEGARLELRPAGRRKLVVLGTREPHCLGDLLLRNASGDFNAEIVAVISQYESLRELTARFGVPYHCVPVVEAEAREEHEERVLEVIQGYSPDYVVLAKYMRILTPGFVRALPDRIVNIHHSFLPAFIGKSPYHQAYERGVKIIGATAHFVNDQLDEGPIITQDVIPVDHSLSAMDMARAGRDVERVVLSRALDRVLEDRVIIHGRRTIVF